MYKKIFFTVGILALFTSCITSKKETKIQSLSDTNMKKTEDIVLSKNEGLKLIKNNCYACHNPNTASHDDIIAPPFKMVKIHYKRKHISKKDFVNAIINWVKNPSEKKVLMPGAVKRFKIMPKMDLVTKDLEVIASYLYDNDLESPKWMKKHVKEKHSNTKGMKGMMKKNN